MKSAKRPLLHSFLALLLCVSMLVSSTFAWFTDQVSTKANIITSGNLDLEMYWTDDLASGTWHNVEEEGYNTIFSYDNWEPGYTEVKYIKLVNAGSLALNYDLAIEAQNGVGKLAEVISVYYGKGAIPMNDRADLDQLGCVGFLNNMMNGGATASGTLLPAGEQSPFHPSGEVVMTVAMSMITSAGNEYQNESSGDFTVRALATQAPYESDSFGSDYDSAAELPTVLRPGSVSVPVTPENGKVPVGGVNMAGDGLSAFVPEGTAMADGADKLTLTVTPMEDTTSGIVAVNDEILIPVDVHVEGVAEGNTVPIVIDLGAVLPKYLNMGNYRLIHVEDGVNQEMTRVSDKADLVAHNHFTYDPATGEVSVAMATFSEVALLSATLPVWEGEFDYTWYDADAEELTIVNGDQLAGFGAIVGGMDGQTQDSFSGKTVTLASDINLGDSEENNNPDVIFYPIGYYNSEGTYERTNTAITSGLRNFEGTFDGAGHTIANFYHNTWEMKGDHDWYSPEEQYYRDGMGLFGRVYGGTVKNLTVSNFSSDGEIATTGCIAAYADGATFENIAITGCNPRVYNIGNGGIVGCVGWYAKKADLKTTFTNITVDNSNKISALWGSYDVACGGIVGQYYPTSGQTSAGTPKNAGIDLVNCHVSAVMDVYNDVCGNYQYYAYRYAGMIIGSIRENTTTTIDGVTKTIPDMTGISAKNCTVNYGDWNDYYYCEFEKNGHPSYSGPNDYKFSRVPHSELKFTDSNGNGSVDANERASVTGCNHDHTDAEDNKAIYLPFHQLFTGYGWGVNSIGLEQYSGIVTNLGITEGDYEGSESKFVTNGELNELSNGIPISVGSLFVEDDKANIPILSNQVEVTVSPADENSTVTGTYDANTTDWTQGTLTFNGVGNATIIITDYYFCTPTTVTVTITERQPAEKFDIVMNNGNFLHRVGNQNTVALDKLFKAKDDMTIGTVSVTVDTVDNTSASGVYAPNATWTNGTIQFSGTGVVKVTIMDDDTFCIPTELYLEVVDAKNLTSATGTTTGGNFVLVSNVSTSTYVNYWNATLYGNGFEYSVKGAPTAYNSKQGKGIIITKNAVLDNVRIIGDEYTKYGAFTENDYYNTVIDVIGDTTIQNCYIANCAAPVRARNNVTIINSTLYGGAVANLIIEDGTTTLEDVTTANYDDGNVQLVGMGVVVHPDATEAAKLVLNGKLTQYNFMSESKVPTDTYAKNLHTAMFSSSCEQYHFGTSPNRYVNTGIVSLEETFNGEDITDNAQTGYVGRSVSLSGSTGYVYTQPNTSGSVNNDYTTDSYVPTTQGAVPPSYSFDFTNKNYEAKTEGSNRYCYEENGIVNISMDEGDTFNWDTSILTIGKGITNYTVTMNGTDYTGKSIAFNTAGNYEVQYTYTDEDNYRINANARTEEAIQKYSVTYTQTVNIIVAVVKPTTKHAEFTFGSSNTASTTVTVGNSTYVMPNVTSTSTTIGSTTVSGQTIYYPIVEIVMSDGKNKHTSGWYAYFPVFSGAVTITDYANGGTGDKMTPYNDSTTTMPSGLSVVGDPKTLFKYQSGSNAGETPVVKNNVLVYSSAKIEAKRNEYNTVIQYSYQDNAGATYYYYIGYHAPAQTYTSCVTADTLVTLADGSQKRIDQVAYADQLLVWDFDKGEYTTAYSSIIENHGYGLNDVIALTFADGTTVKVVNVHGFFDVELNKWVDIKAENAQEYIGHSFTQTDGNSYKTVMLVSATVSTEYVEAWSILTTDHYNCVLEGMFSITPPATEQLAFFEIGEGMKYDADAKQEDIEKYGLFTYEEFAHLLTYEQFEVLNIAEIKIAIGKGLITMDEVLWLIETYT